MVPFRGNGKSARPQNGAGGLSVLWAIIRRLRLWCFGKRRDARVSRRQRRRRGRRREGEEVSPSREPNITEAVGVARLGANLQSPPPPLGLQVRPHHNHPASPISTRPAPGLCQQPTFLLRRPSLVSRLGPGNDRHQMSSGVSVHSLAFDFRYFALPGPQNKDPLIPNQQEETSPASTH